MVESHVAAIASNDVKLARYDQFDTLAHALGDRDLDQRVVYVKNLIDAGFIAKILLSHDVCLRTHLSAFDGPGFTMLGGKFRRLLLDGGVAPEEFRIITEDNPAAALTPRPC